MDDRIWITTAEASDLSGYHPERVRELAREKKIIARKWGSAYQIDQESLLTYVREAKKVGDKRFGPKTKRSKS